jgi:hypothetical protein
MDKKNSKVDQKTKDKLKIIFSHFSTYLFIGLILLIIFLILLTYEMYVNKRIYDIQAEPSIWCFDDWHCDTFTTNTDSWTNECFSQTQYAQTGLFSCLYGLGSTLSTICYDSTCSCPSTLTGSNCFYGCPYSGNEIKSLDHCCAIGNSTEQCPQ